MSAFPDISFLGVFPSDHASLPHARELCDELKLDLLDSLPLIHTKHEPTWPACTYLDCASKGLSLCALDAPKLAPLHVDFTSGKLAWRRTKGGGAGQLIAKALGVGKFAQPRILDATFGLGRDAFVLAGLGCTVLGLERQAPIFALTRDGMRRAAAAGDASLRECIARMELRHADALQVLPELIAAFQPHAMLLDPMYPHQRGSALPSKEMRLLRPIAGEDLDAPRLIDLALASGIPRVAVKRPRKSPALSERKIHHVAEGKSTRFDVYLKH